MAQITCQHPDGCPRPARKRGWCTMHYQRVMAKGDPGPAQKTTRWGEAKDLGCSVDGCEAPHRAGGLCGFHHSRKRFTGSTGPAHRLRRSLPPEMRHYTAGERHRFYKYNLTPEAFEAILASQGGRCYVCHTDTPTAKGWSVDHCHETNTVRFIACNPCNAALGLIREDPDIAKRLWEVTIECQARKGAEVRVTDLVEWAVSVHPDLVEERLKERHATDHRRPAAG